jgi:hypothetical protein
VPTANVRDVEPGAWTPDNAVNRAQWHTPRPTIYCDQNDLERTGGVLSLGWKGDLWLAIPGWTTDQALPATPGCTVVAVQDLQGASAGVAYDLSTVLDPTWPSEAAVELTSYKTGTTQILRDTTRTPAVLQIAGIDDTTGVYYLTDLTPGAVPVQVTDKLIFGP